MTVKDLIERLLKCDWKMMVYVENMDDSVRPVVGAEVHPIGDEADGVVIA